MGLHEKKCAYSLKQLCNNWFISPFKMMCKPAEPHSNRSCERASGYRETLFLPHFRPRSQLSVIRHVENQKLKTSLEILFLPLTPATNLPITFSKWSVSPSTSSGTHSLQDKASAFVSDSMTEDHALCRSPDVHHRSSAREWAHRHTLAQTSCRGTDRTLFWQSEASAAARKLTLSTDLTRTRPHVAKRC